MLQRAAVPFSCIQLQVFVSRSQPALHEYASVPGVQDTAVFFILFFGSEVAKRTPVWRLLVLAPENPKTMSWTSSTKDRDLTRQPPSLPGFYGVAKATTIQTRPALAPGVYDRCRAVCPTSSCRTCWVPTEQPASCCRSSQFQSTRQLLGPKLRVF